MDNTVGSLTKFQRSIVIGSLLGDGYLRRIQGRSNALLEINHSTKAKEYVDWKYNALRNVSGKRPQVRQGNGNRIAYRFYTKQLPELTVIMEAFYKNRKKIIPEDLVLDPLVLAIWFMDDGSRCRESDYYLNTQQFSHSDQKKLLDKLCELHIVGNLNRDKKYWRIRLYKKSIPKFKELVKEFIIPSMQYKLGYNPVETDLPKAERIVGNFNNQYASPTKIL